MWRMLALSWTVLPFAACGAGTNERDDPSAASTEEITGVSHSPVKNQTIGNCWVYTTIGWVEALNKGATSVAPDYSESYLTYWSWFEEIVNGGSRRTEIDGAGSWTTGIEMLSRYGILREKDFIPEESGAIESARQATALATVNLALKSGELMTLGARHDRAKVRDVLDRAFELRPLMVAALDATFGRSVSRTLNRNVQPTEGGILRTNEVPVRLKDGPTKAPFTGRLSDAIGTGRWDVPREGPHAWNVVVMPVTKPARRNFERRVQAALHDAHPVAIGWWVDFNALNDQSEFKLETVKSKGPGSQGGHMTVLHDYQAEVPSVGLLEVGVTATPAQMTAALSTDTKIIFWRTKNSWGIDPASTIDPAGYYDLYTDYMMGPIQLCDQVMDASDLAHCVMETPWTDALLPPGY